MAAKLNKLPVVYIASKIPGLHEHIKMIMPKENSVISFYEIGSEVDVLKNVEVLLCDGEVLQSNTKYLNNLKWAHCTWAGVENVLQSISKNVATQPFMLTRHGGDEFSSLMGEYVFAQIINFERNLHDIYKFTEQGLWVTPQKEVRTLSELIVGIMGIGVMGLGVAKYLKAGGASVYGFAYTNKILQDSKYKDFSLISTNLADVISECDYIVNCLPSTPLTQHLLEEKLKLCSKKPVFINVGRSNIITEKSLLLALRNQWITAAILDVFDEEPLPQSSELWKVPEIIITPHVAAPSRVKDIAKVFKQNFEKYVCGENLDYVVNLKQGY